MLSADAGRTAVMSIIVAAVAVVHCGIFPDGFVHWWFSKSHKKKHWKSRTKISFLSLLEKTCCCPYRANFWLKKTKQNKTIAETLRILQITGDCSLWCSGKTFWSLSACPHWYQAEMITRFCAVGFLQCTAGCVLQGTYHKNWTKRINFKLLWTDAVQFQRKPWCVLWFVGKFYWLKVVQNNMFTSMPFIKHSLLLYQRKEQNWLCLCFVYLSN